MINMMNSEDRDQSIDMIANMIEIDRSGKEIETEIENEIEIERGIEIGENIENVMVIKLDITKDLLIIITKKIDMMIGMIKVNQRIQDILMKKKEVKGKINTAVKMCEKTATTGTDKEIELLDINTKITKGKAITEESKIIKMITTQNLQAITMIRFGSRTTAGTKSDDRDYIKMRSSSNILFILVYFIQTDK